MEYEQPLIRQDEMYLTRGKVDLDRITKQCRPGAIMLVDYLDDIRLISPAREWFEPIEDED